MPVVGGIEFTVSPDLGNFESQLRAQLQPIIARVEAQFAKLGATAGASFGSALTQSIGSAVAGAAPRPGVLVDKFGKPFREAAVGAADQFGAGLKIGDAVGGAASKAAPKIKGAGEESGRVFGSGFGEGFAALAAFAIAARVGRFFRETVSSAVEFESAFAGVRRVVEATPAQFDALRQSIVGMSEQLPFAAKGIADVAAEAGRLGVPLQNVESFTETILKFATITGQAPVQAATAFAKFSTVTGASLADSEHLADVVLKLGTAFAANETEVLEFSKRLAPLAALSKATGEDVLALSTAIVQVGGRAESGGTAVTQAFDQIQKAAASGGLEASNFANVLRVSVDTFQQLVATDPTEVFVRLLEGIQREGANAGTTLDALGLGSRRTSIQLRALAASSDTVRDALDKSRDAAGELNRQFSIFSATPEAKLKVLNNTIQNTKIQIGGVLATGIIPLVKGFADLSTGTIAVTAAFAGLAAGGFAFVRFSSIFREFSKTFGAGVTSAQEFSTAMRFAQQQGIPLTAVLRTLTAEKISLAEADRRLAAGDTELALKFGIQKTQALGLVASFKAARIAAEELNLGLFATARAALAGAGGFNALIGIVGKASIFLLVADFATQAIRGVQNFFDTLLRGQQNIDAVTIALQKFAIGTGSIGEVFDKARVPMGGFRDELAKTLTTTPLVGFARTIQDTNIPVLGHLAGAVATVGSTVVDVANKVPLLGRIINTESENATKSFGDLNQGLTQLLEKLGPTGAKVAGALFTKIQSSLKGRDLDDFNKATEEFQTKIKNAAAAQTVFGANAEEAQKNLQGMGLTAEEAGTFLQELGVKGAEGLSNIAGKAQAVEGALNALTTAQAAFASRVTSLILPISGVAAAQQKLSKAGSGGAKSALTSARAIADAERALAEAREDANRRIADAQRKLSEAEEDAARRVLEANRRLEESRIQSSRRLRDAGEDLADFRDALKRVGGALTPEDAIRQRELQQAVADASEDAARTEVDNQRAVVEAQRDGAEKIAEALRRLQEVEEEAAEKIEDALRRLARAHEDAANRSGAAAAKMSDAINLSFADMLKGFRDRANELNTFSSLMGTVANRVFAAFGDRQLGEAFLADLQEMGVEAIPILKNLVNASDAQLAGLGTAFSDQIKAAKKAADIQFEKFEPNFKAQIAPAIKATINEITPLLGTFDNLGDKGSDTALLIGEKLGELTTKFQELAIAGGGAVNPRVLELLELARAATAPAEKVRILKELIDGIRDQSIPIVVEFSADTKKLEEQFQAAVKRLVAKGAETGGLFGSRKMGGTVVGPFAQIPKAQFGTTSRAGTPILVGRHTAEELFIPSTSGAIFRHTDTTRILRALQVARTGVTNQNITVNQVAEDPLATARAISFQIGSGGAIR